MTERQEQLLKILVESYIKTAEPVSSSALAEHSNLGVSSATIRNDLAEMDAQGYLVSPHTSAGRVPTDKGYRYYIETFLNKKRKLERERKALAERAHAQNREMRLRQMAKALSELTGNAVVLTLGPRRSYTTGVSRLFELPEFASADQMRRFSQLMDTMDSMMAPLTRKRFDDVRIMIGNESPFGERMSSMLISFDDPSGGHGVVSIVGPTRMNYGYNRALLREVRRLLTEM